ncbi:hypothetical protein TNCV_603101 [Trichonephila clavipes]|nr:hypothetical protein TNCV_603101 [Trichonephila clavipes]
MRERVPICTQTERLRFEQQGYYYGFPLDCSMETRGDSHAVKDQTKCRSSTSLFFQTINGSLYHDGRIHDWKPRGECICIRYRHTDSAPSVLRFLRINRMVCDEMSSSNLDSDEHIRLEESVFEESEEKADIIDIMFQ